MVTAVAAVATALPASAASAAGPTYTIEDPAFLYANNCATRTGPFEPITYAPHERSHVLYGIRQKASYHIEVPRHWNHQLVLWAHGYNGTGTLLCAGVPNIDRAWYLQHGYAWAASSYSDNGYDVTAGVKDTHDLIALFTAKVHKPTKVWMTGESMGGHITAVMIEHYRHDFVGAMPVCGVLGGTDLFNYYLDANATAAALAGIPKAQMPYDVTAPQWETLGHQISSALLTSFPTNPTPTTPQGVAWAGALANVSGGFRPGFAGAFGFWNSFGFPPYTDLPFLIGLYPGTSDGTIGVASGNVAGNLHQTYQLDADPALSPAEQALNAEVERVAADPSAKGRGLSNIPAVHGNPSVPVLSLHGIGDLFVPLRMEQDYARNAAAKGKADLFVTRAIREVNHCSFTQRELQQGFTDLVNWVNNGVHPAGDNVLDPAVVASPSFGCRFTDPTPGAHPAWTLVHGPACPTG